MVEGKTRALWYVSPGCVELRFEDAPRSGADRAVVRASWSALSRGTERLIFNGKVPPAEYQRMRAPLQGGDFPFPVKYGYCATGVVEDGPVELQGRDVFVLHPHQEKFAAPVAMMHVVPPSVPARRACLAANMETALNAVWDAAAGPGDRIVIVGAGVIGLLTARLCSRLPGADVAVCDIDETRRTIVENFGARFVTPSELGASDFDADVVFHASATPPGLAAAIDAAGLEARIVEMSWFGEGATPAPLGGAFHSRRLQLIASQVGQVSPSRRPRWSYARRIAKALDLLADERLDQLFTHEFAFGELETKLPQFLATGAPGLTAAIRY